MAYIGHVLANFAKCQQMLADIGQVLAQLYGGEKANLGADFGEKRCSLHSATRRN